MTRLVADQMAARITLLPTPRAVATRAAGVLAEALRAGVVERGLASLALSGGSTPIPTFHELRERDLDWSRVCVTLVDERWVDPASPDSNQKALELHFLTGPARAARFVPMKNSALSPLTGIGRHVQALHTVPRPLDAVLLGMGEDGHFASLFPNSRALRIGLDLDSDGSCVAVPAAEDGSAPAQDRLSLTLAILVRARRLVLLTSGDRKLDVLQRAIETPCNPIDLPIAALLAARPDVEILHSVQ
jgi:6-phosphogluconolactonase